MSNTTLPAAVQRVVDAINNADIEAFVSAFAEDGYVDDWGRILKGSKGVRSWANSDAIGAGAKMTVLDASTEADLTQLRFGWQSRVFNGESTAFITVRDDRVVSFQIPPHS